MSQRDGFTSGFIAGALVGGLVGGVIGVLVGAGRDSDENELDKSLLDPNLSKGKAIKSKKRQLQAEASIEVARRSLEDKIAQLNTAIDDVRQQLGNVNGNPDPIDKDSAPNS